MLKIKNIKKIKKKKNDSLCNIPQKRIKYFSKII